MKKLFMVVPHSDNNKKTGFVTLLSVLIVGAVGVSLSVGLLMLGIDAGKTSLVIEHREQAKGLANACAETALQQVRNSTPYTGSDTLTLETGTCTYTVTSLGGQTRRITAQGTAGETVRKISLTISQINPTISIASWQEVADF